jgi:hypothetical protein
LPPWTTKGADAKWALDKATVPGMSTTKTTPIVMAIVSDPVGDGLVASLARPGGNITGFSGVPKAQRSVVLFPSPTTMVRRLMMRTRLLKVALFGCTVLTAPATAQQHGMAPMSDAKLIKSAESAAPASISRNATVIAMGQDGKMRTVRKGTNGFTCMPDNPTTPGPDPMCMDQNALEWATAWMEHKEPPTGKVGFMYMLAGGTDASNTDPYAQKPDANNNWVKTGPHVMIVGAKGMLASYPRDAKPDTKKPYVMWPDRPYEHLMVPVK